MSVVNNVFVYGTLKRGHGANGSLHACKFLGEAVIEGFVMGGNGGFPGVSVGRGKVRGEVYEMGEGVLPHLDRYEGYPSLYDRAVVDTPFGKAWVYTINDRSVTPFQHDEEVLEANKEFYWDNHQVKVAGE